MEFTLFRGDPFNEALRRVWTPLGDPSHAPLRVAVLFCLTWGMLAVLSLLSGVALGPTLRETFLADFAAYGQFLIAVPAFMLAEPLMDAQMRDAVRSFGEAGLVQDATRFTGIVQQTMAARLWGWVDVALLVVVYVSTWAWMAEELTNGSGSWHARLVNGHEIVTPPGLWVWFVAVPVWFYLLARWAYKILLWTVLLARLSRLRLGIIATHPDGAGGLGFLASVQAGFGTVIFAIGAAVACTVGYKVTIENAPTGTYATDGPWLAFILIAPVGFLAPLLMFTRQMYEAKFRDALHYRAASMEMARAFDERWIRSGRYLDRDAFSGNPDIQSYANMSATFKDVVSMRVVPFDLATVGRLLLSAASPMLPLVIGRYPVLKILRDLIAGQ